MKTIVGRFATAADAAQAQASLNTSFPQSTPRGSISNRVSLATAVSVVVGAILGLFTANGTLADWGVTLDGGKTYLGLLSSDPGTLFGYTVLGFALGIPVGLVVGMVATIFPQRGGQPFRVLALTHHGQTVIVQSDNGHADQIAKLLTDGQAQRVQTLNGRIDPVQVSVALDQLSRQF